MAEERSLEEILEELVQSYESRINEVKEEEQVTYTPPSAKSPLKEYILSKPKNRLINWGVGLAALAMVAFVGYYMFRPSRKPEVAYQPRVEVAASPQKEEIYEPPKPITQQSEIATPKKETRPIPNRPPTINASLTKSVIYLPESLSFIIDGNDPDNDGFELFYRIDNGGWLPIREGVKVPEQPVGRHTFYGKAVDSNGLESEIASSNFEVRRNQPPTLTASLNKTTFNPDEQPVLTVNARDPDNHNMNVYMLNSNNDWVRMVNGRQNIKAMPVGNYRVRLKATDQYGLESEEWRESFTVKSPQPPNTRPTSASSPIRIAKSYSDYVVLTPNGSEKWQIGTTQIIRWSTPKYHIQGNNTVDIMKGVLGDLNKSERISRYNAEDPEKTLKWFIDPSIFSPDTDYWIYLHSFFKGEDISDSHFVLSSDEVSRAESNLPIPVPLNLTTHKERSYNPRTEDIEDEVLGLPVRIENAKTLKHIPGQYFNDYLYVLQLGDKKFDLKLEGEYDVEYGKCDVKSNGIDYTVGFRLSRRYGYEDILTINITKHSLEHVLSEEELVVTPLIKRKVKQGEKPKNQPPSASTPTSEPQRQEPQTFRVTYNVNDKSNYTERGVPTNILHPRWNVSGNVLTPRIETQFRRLQSRDRSLDGTIVPSTVAVYFDNRIFVNLYFEFNNQRDSQRIRTKSYKGYDIKFICKDGGGYENDRLAVEIR